MALFGRFLVGFGSAEVVNRQLISACVSFHYMTEASALFVAAGASGMSIGPLIAAILDLVSGRDNAVDLPLSVFPAGGLIYNHVTSPGFVMAFLWFLELISLLLLFDEPTRINAASVLSTLGTARPLYESVPSSLLAPLKANDLRHYGSTGNVASNSKTPRFTAWDEIVKVSKLIFSNMGLPVTMFLFSFIELVDEVLISSCAMVCRRYFEWNGSKAGFLIASLGALVIPAHYFVEKASRHFQERGIMKVRSSFLLIVIPHLPLI